MPLPDSECWWKKVSAISSCGDSLDLVWHVREYDWGAESGVQPPHFWEIRHYLDRIYNEKKGVYVIVNKHKFHWVGVLTRIGVSITDHLHVPCKSAKVHGLSCELASYEYEASTMLTVIVLMHARAHPYKKISAKATGVMHAFFLSALPADSLGGVCYFEVPLDIVEAFADTADGDKVMVDRARGELQKIHGNSRADPQSKVADQLNLLYHMSENNEMIFQFFERVVVDCVVAIDKHRVWESTFTNDYQKDGRDLTLAGKCKRRRMDPGLQKSLARVSSQRLASTTSAFIRANPGLYGANHGLRFNDQSVRSKLSASWLSFSESQHVSVVADGITSGSPATDNLVIAAYDPEKRPAAQVHYQEVAVLKMHAFFDAEAKTKLTQELQDHPEFKQQRIANTEYGLALDKAMQVGIGCPTSRFMVKHPLQPLKQTEQRYLAMVDSPLGRQQRSCIFDTLTKKARLELIHDISNGKVVQPTLYMCMDRCSVGRGMMDFFQVGTSMRTVCHYDPWHIIEGFIKSAYVACGLHSRKLQAMVCYRAFSGPFHSCAFWNAFKSCATHFFKISKSDCPLYDICYPLICEDRGISMEQQIDPSFREKLWKLLPSSACFHRMGFQPVLGRWGNFESKHTAFNPDRSVILMILLHMGIQKGWWKDVQHSPLFKVLTDVGDVCDDDGLHDLAGGGDDADGPPDPPAPAGGLALAAKPKVKDSNAALQRVRQSRVNTLDFACWYLADIGGSREMDAATIAVGPLTELFHVHLTTHKTLWGHQEFFNGLSEGLLIDTIVKTWDLMRDPSTMRSLGLATFDRMGWTSLESDKKVAQVLFDCCVSVTANLGVYEFEFTHSLYGFCPRLLQTTDQATLKE
ncbi:unnamed protein product, partial [Prorocentrum cordatum]